MLRLMQLQKLKMTMKLRLVLLQFMIFWIPFMGSRFTANLERECINWKIVLWPCMLLF